MTSNKYVESLLILAMVLFFFPYLSLGFSTNDDAFNQVYHSWIEFKDGAFKQGRIQFFLFHWLVIKLSFLVENIVFIKFLATLSVIANIVYFSWFLEKITSQKFYGYLFAIVCITFMQDSWDHFLLTSSPLIYTVAFSLFLGSLHLYLFCNPTKLNLIVSAFFFLLTLQISEMFFLFCVFFPLFSTIYLQKGVFYNLKYHIIFSAIYMAVYVVFRMVYGTDYAGNSVGEFSVISYLKTLAIYSLYTFPGTLFLSNSLMGVGDINEYLDYPFDFNLSINLFSKFRYNLKIIVKNLAEINITWIIKYLLFVFISLESLKQVKKIEMRTVILLLAFSVLLIFVPNALHSLTGKYQDWALLSNSKGYVGTYISWFGMGLLMTFSLAFLKLTGWFDRPTILSRIGLSLIVAMLFFVSIFVSISNEAIFNQKKQSHYRWVLMDKFFRSEAFKQLKDGDDVHTLGLTDRIGIVDRYKPNPDERSDYWDRYALMKTGKRVHFLEGYPDGNASGKGKYLLKLIQPKTDYDTFIVFAKMKQNVKLIDDFYLLAAAKETSILSYETLAGFKSLPFRLKDKNAYMLIEAENVSVNSISVNHQVRNRKDVMVFSKPMKEGNIYTDRIEYEFADGFYIEESSGMNTWHWSRKQSQLRIINNSDEKATVQMAFLLITGQEKASDIAIFQNEDDKKVVKVGNKDKETELFFTLEPGENVIHFSATEAAKMPPGIDARDLYFYVKNLIVMETL